MTLEMVTAETGGGRVGVRAARPPEAEGLRRDHVRLLVVDRATRKLTHTRFHRIGDFLGPGDLLVVNRSRTLPAALFARTQSGDRVQLRLCIRRPGAWDVLAVEPAPPYRPTELRAGERISFDGTAALVEGRHPEIPYMWRITLTKDDLDPLLREGEPIRYSYVPEPVSADFYQTVFATEPGSAETPSAGRAFSWELLLQLRGRGVALSSLVLHTGLSSFQDDAYDAEHHLYEEWFELPADTALAVESARRVIAVGTTVVRALETAGRTGRPLHPQRGWTRLRITPQTPIGVVAALLTGFHEPVASHFELLRAFLREPLLDQAYAEAVERAYRWHEFGDLMLIL